MVVFWLVTIDTVVAFTSPHMLVRSSFHSGQSYLLAPLFSSGGGLAVLNNTAYTLLSEEARFVRAIRACADSAEVQAVLDRADDPISPNLAAAAMRTMVKYERRCAVAKNALPTLLSAAELGVVEYGQGKNTNMSLFALQDVLYSISIMRRDDLLPLATMIFDLMASNMSLALDKLEPRRLVEIMEAANSLSLHTHVALLDAIAARLAKSDAVGKLAPSKICAGLLPLASYPITLIRFLRRLRKNVVRSELSTHHITMAIHAAAIIQTRNPDLRQEVWTTAFTLVNRELTRPIFGNTTILATQLSSHQSATILFAVSKFGWDTVPVVVEDLYQFLCAGSSVAPMDVAFTLQSLANISVVNKPDLALRLGNKLLEWLKGGNPIELRYMNLILTSVYRQFKAYPDVLKNYEIALTHLLLNDVYDDQFRRNITEYDLAMYIWFFAEAGTERNSEIGYKLGSLLSLMTSETSDPASFVMALRYAVKMYARVIPTVLSPFLEAAKNRCRGDFLMLLKCMDLSFLVEALVIAKCPDESLFYRLAQTAMRLHMVDECTPSSARRIISSFTTILPRIPSSRLQECRRQLFDLLGATLLTTQLLPYEAADAVFSYAKAGYISDMGVFDHVTDIVGRDLASLSTKQVAKCLWACGKMYTWEHATPDLEAPPYLNTAKVYAKHLSFRQSELSAQDLAQSLWAMGKLDIIDPITTGSFAMRAKLLLPHCFACETSNIIWGLSKVGYDDEKVMISVSRRMLDADVSATPEEAACVLYALGNAGIREDEVFEHLTDIMMNQVELVGAQAMANALWAHNVVGKLPPPALLQSWASEKLGLVGFLPPRPDYEWDVTK